MKIVKALSLYLYYVHRYSFFYINLNNNQLTNTLSKLFHKSINFFFIILVFSYIFTLNLCFALALSTLIVKYTNKYL